MRVGAAVAVVAGALSLAAAATPAAASTGPTPVTKASTSARGVSAKSINVVFPVISFNSIEGQFEIESDAEYGEQGKAISLFVNQINDAGGINGRKINPMIELFDPTDAAAQRALCKQWTEGNPPVFAVLDGLGTWEGDNELCVTQEGHTPMLAQWTTTTNWTDLGSPYLWWTGPDDAAVLAATVTWGIQSHRLGHGKKVAVVVSDQDSDQLAFKDYLLPDLEKVGIRPVVQTISADLGETASTDSSATLAVERLKADGIQSVIPMLPENAFTPYLAAETSQQFFPTLLLSDYQFSIEIGLGLIPFPYEKALNGQEGVTTETLGGIDSPIFTYADGGYDPGVRSCWDTWHAAYPQTPKGNINDYIEEQGPVQAWCQQIRLFAKAATMAGKHLTRRTFVEAMSRITNFAGGYSPVLSYGPDKFYGPTQYRVVELHNNQPPSSLCKRSPAPAPPAGVCWVVEQNWKPLPSTS
ncbi:MAG TPA: ABC transporter substrate-binding protein [Acidimicrobiales bacterium]|nr:ABC transporter substrate-binding protein [Acidimicrobiales bacterium]